MSDDPEDLSLALVRMGFEQIWRGVVGQLEFYHDHLDALKRVLLLLAQDAIKKEPIESIRNKLDADDGNHVFSLPIRYPLMAELILKTAFKTEINVDCRIEGAYAEVTPRSLITIPETGFDSSRKRDLIIIQISRLFPDIKDLPEKERLEKLKNKLEAYFISQQPYFVVHDDSSPINISYMSEFIIPSRKESVPPDAVSNIAEAKLCELIKIILTTFDEMKKRGA